MGRTLVAAVVFSAAACLSLSNPAQGAGWIKLITPDLEGWEKVGDGVWTVMHDGTLVGQRHLEKAKHQAWLYTKSEYGEFDLYLEWWTRVGGNSGVSIRDTSRGRYAVGAEWDPKRTPSHIGYEIQILNGSGDKFPSGSVYLFDQAKTGFQRDDDWNEMLIESRDDLIRVRLNGHPVSQYPGEPGRPKRGPIGLQLHDKSSIAMFRNIRIRELKHK